MESITKNILVVISLLIIASVLFWSPLVYAFQEGWESSSIGTYVPSSHDNLPLPLIPADEGDWLLGDTVSEFPECGPSPHTAEILLSGDNRSLRLTSNNSNSSCADNVWVNLFEVPQLNLNPGFSVPLTSGTIISFEETGNLINPQAGSPYCVLPPCGDTVSLTLEDTRGNMLAYVLQRAPDAVPNEVRSYYREVFIDPNAGDYSRNLFADFNTIPDFSPSGATIRTVAFKVSEHGTATIDNICIGTSGCVPPPLIAVPDVVGLPQSEAEAAIVADNLIVGTITWQISVTVPTGSVISQYPDAGTEVNLGTIVNLVISTGVPETQALFIAYPQSGVPPLTVNFDEYSNGQINSWEWDFGDGTSSTVREPSHTYTRPGTYSVSLTVTGTYGSDTEVKTDYIYVDVPNANEFKLFPSEGEPWEPVNFGESVSIFGRYAIVGAPYEGANGNGAAYIFEKNGTSWNEVTKLTVYGGTNRFFGQSVAISDKYAIVGAPGNQSRIGAVYIFEKDGSSWNEIDRLSASDGYTNDNFGFSVSISGDHAIVGAQGHYYSYGAAYIFEKNGTSWNEVAKLSADAPRIYDQFGQSVSISGNYAIVGAYREEYGAAYIFEKIGSSWNPLPKLTASDVTARFGQSVSISGGYAIVGAYADNDKGSGAGAAYIFARSDTGWSEVTKLTASDGAAGDSFSYNAVSISGACAIVGASGDDDNGNYSGSAYIFQNMDGSWEQVAKLTAGGGVANDYFGHGVSASNGYAIVGAYGYGLSGAASIFDLSIPNIFSRGVVTPLFLLLLLGE